MVSERSEDERIRGRNRPYAGAGTHRAFDTVVCTLAGVAEAVLVVWYRVAAAPVELVLCAHAAVLIALGLAIGIRGRAGGNTAILTICLTTTLVTGPVGAFSSAVIAATQRDGRRSLGLLDKWYERISGQAVALRSDTLYQTLQDGRAPAASDPLPDRFESVLRDGSLAEKQMMLGVIGMRYHPAFFGALQAALNCGEAPIRVQAAAIMAKLRAAEYETFNALLAEAGSEALRADRRSGIARGLVSRAKSGLLQDHDVALAIRTAKSIYPEAALMWADDEIVMTLERDLDPGRRRAVPVDRQHPAAADGRQAEDGAADLGDRLRNLRHAYRNVT